MWSRVYVICVCLVILSVGDLLVNCFVICNTMTFLTLQKRFGKFQDSCACNIDPNSALVLKNPMVGMTAWPIYRTI
jgi:hypothetical protein